MLVLFGTKRSILRSLQNNDVRFYEVVSAFDDPYGFEEMISVEYEVTCIPAPERTINETLTFNGLVWNNYFNVGVSTTSGTCSHEIIGNIQKGRKDLDEFIDSAQAKPGTSH